MKSEAANQRCDDERWRITECHCGQITLRIGAIRLDFTPEEFARLHRLVDEASRKLQPGISSPQTAGSKTFTH